MSPSTPCYWSGVEERYPYDQAKAESLLDEAGWVDTDGDGIRDKDGQPLLLDLPTHGEYPALRDPCPIIQGQLAEVGIDVNVQNLAVPAWVEAGKTGNQHLGIQEWRTSDPDFLRLEFVSEDPTPFAWSFHDNAHLNDILQQTKVEVDPEARCGLFEEAQQIIMDEAQIKPINLSSAILVVRTEAKGLKLDSLRTSFFWVFDAYLEG
jgi:peptide/nickel transport system substrate-binding protein